MTNEKDVPFLIVGGGIGGLATALGVAKTGRSVQVLESAPEFAEIGAGIQLAPNATAVLDQLGVLDAISEYAVFPKRLVLMDAVSGKELSALDLGDSFRERYGYPYIVLHRSDLHKTLLDACIADDRITLLNNKTVKTAENLGDKAQVACTDGTTYLADAVIGADGLWSNTRQLFSQDKAICSQYVAYRGAIPMSEITPSADLDDVIMWIGPNLHLVQYPVRRKELYNQVVVFKSFRYKEDSDDWGTPEELDEHFGRCCEPVRHAVTFIQRQRRWPMYDREPIDNWTSGRITLLGDSAHPMLQYLAQGGCQALEDAACLTKQLSLHGNDTEKAFLAYQEDRIPRTAKVQRSARLWGEFLHTEDEMATFLRNMMLTQRGPQDFEPSDWLYGRRYN